jgi:hypothetical protein
MELSLGYSLFNRIFSHISSQRIQYILQQLDISLLLPDEHSMNTVLNYYTFPSPNLNFQIAHPVFSVSATGCRNRNDVTNVYSWNIPAFKIISLYFIIFN